MKTAEMASLQPPHRANDTRAGGPGRVAEEITELVGETPVLHLRKLVPADAADVYAKLEYLNPGGSIKDRAALGMITKAEQAGKLRPGATIFEATAGNTGVGLALIGSGRGYKTVLAVPEGFSQEKVTLMEALGAEVIRTPEADGMQGAIDYVKERAANTPNSFIAGQFENQDNPDYHYETTAREFYEQIGGQIDAIVIGCGTGGTFSGVARYLERTQSEDAGHRGRNRGICAGRRPERRSRSGRNRRQLHAENFR